MRRIHISNPLLVASAVAVTCLLGTPAYAQRGGGHASSGGGQAVSSGGGGQAVAAGGGASSSGSGGGGTTGSSGGSGRSAWSGGHAVARSGGAQATGSGAAGGNAVMASSAGGAVPRYSRPTNGPVVGQAVPRGSVNTAGGGTSYVLGYPYYGYGYGIYGDPYGYGYGSSLFGGYSGYLGDFGFFGPGYGGLGLGDDLFGASYGSVGMGYDPYSTADSTFVPFESGGGYSSSTESFKTGALRLHVKPDNASVYVDGNLAGIVDNFDGVFQKLKLPAGNHQVDLRADGYAPATFHVRIQSGQTESYRGELEKTAKK